MPKTALFGVLMILLFSSSVIGEPMHDHDYIPSQEFDSKYQIQPPTCHISTAELLATARGTAQDLLRGVCDPKDLESRLAMMETLLTDQLNVLKTMILNVEDKLGNQEEQYKKQFRRVQATLMRRIPTATGSTSVGAAVSGTSLKPTDESFYGRHAMPRNLQPTSTSPPGSGPTTSGNQNKPEATSNKHFADLDETVVPGDDHHGILAGADQVFGTDTMQEVSDSFRLSYLDHGQDVGKFDAGSRQYEIDTYNATISELNGQRVYRYYWRVKDLQYKITSWGQRRSLRSESFYVFTYGYRMYIRIYPRHNNENFYIHVGLTQGEYDQLLPWPFKLKHFVTVLDLSQDKPEDLNSRLWDPKELCSGWNWRRPATGDNYECVGLGFPIDLLKSRNYIVDDSVVLRLTVFLDSA